MEARHTAAWIRLGFALAVIAPAAHAARAIDEAAALQGCWRVERTVTHYQDGTTTESQTSCVTRYGQGRYATECPDPAGAAPSASTEGRSKGVGGGGSRAAPTPPKHQPDMVGRRSTIHFHLSDWRLVTMAYPPRLPGIKPIAAVESTSVRVREDAASSACPQLPAS